MNRVIIIGNGFDLAHNLKTSYKNFINNFWEMEKQKIINSFNKNRSSYSDNYIAFTNPHDVFLLNNITHEKGFLFIDNLDRTLRVRSNYNSGEGIYCVQYKNKFLHSISCKSHLKNWVDIEEEYYHELNLCRENKEESNVEKLHLEFSIVQSLLEKYLMEQSNIDIEAMPKLYDNIYSELCHDDFIEKLTNDEKLENILFLNFNYTPTIKRYYFDEKISLLIHIHGELENSDNPIIFGYGDEIDQKYSDIENENNNEYFKNIKSFKYSITKNYRNMLRFIHSDNYQVFIMGHSCGLSDRTLLNTIFEHQNCKSIKIFYFVDAVGNDSYNETYMNLSRNYKSKQKMREIVVSKDLSTSYVNLQEIKIAQQ